MNVDAAVLTSLGTLVAAIGAVLVGWRNARKVDDARDKAVIAAAQAAESKAAIVKVGDGVFEVGRRIDGRLSELLETTAKLARAEGVVEGRNEAKK